MTSANVSPRFRSAKRSVYFASLLACLACSPTPPLWAVDPPPELPLVLNAPAPSSWVITVQQKKPIQLPTEPKAAALYKRVAAGLPRVLRVEVDKAGANRREVIFWEDKRTSSIFVYGGLVIYQPLDWRADQASAVPLDSPLSPLKGSAKSDFEDVDWVRPDVYVDKRSYAGQECFYYEDKKHAPLSGGNPLDKPVPGVRAWIEVKSRLPIAVEDDAVLKTFAYHQTNVRVELTGVFAKTYEKAVESEKKLKEAQNKENPGTP